MQVEKPTAIGSTLTPFPLGNPRILTHENIQALGKQITWAGRLQSLIQSATKAPGRLAFEH